MLGEPRPDVAVVAPRWTDCDPEMVEAAVAVRVSIFMEKPTASTLAECDRMIDDLVEAIESDSEPVAGGRVRIPLAAREHPLRA